MLVPQRPSDFQPNHFAVLHKINADLTDFHSTSEQPEDAHMSFNVFLPLSDIPDQVAEQSLEINAFPDNIQILQDQPTTFDIVTAGSKKGELLVDCLGFTYTKKFSGKTMMDVQCLWVPQVLCHCESAG